VVQEKNKMGEPTNTQKKSQPLRLEHIKYLMLMFAIFFFLFLTLAKTGMRSGNTTRYVQENQKRNGKGVTAAPVFLYV
jgi:hypothetical protein